jgi:capsular exopolysaccharide synthesis family protein
MNDKGLRKEVNLSEYWHMIVKRKWVIVSFTGALVFFTAVFSFLATPLYRSTARLYIEEESSKMLSIDQTFRYQPQVIRDSTFFNTQIKLIKSKSLAERVVQRANLLSRPGFGQGDQPKKSLLRSIWSVVTFQWLSTKKKSDEKESDPFVTTNPYSGPARQILRAISVTPVRDTRLIDVSFVSPNPSLAAEILNILIEEFKSFSLEKRYEFTQQASDFLSDQISTLQKDLASKEMELTRYSKEKDIFSLSPTESMVLNELSRITSAHTEARMVRFEKESIYRELSDLDADSIAQFVRDPTLQDLKYQYIRLNNEYDEKLESLKESHPEMVQRKARLDSILGELQKAVATAESEYNAARQNENSLRLELERQKEKVAASDSNAIHYNMIKDEVDNLRRLVNTLDQRRTEAQVSAKLRGLEAGNISIIDSGEIPEYPFSPRKKFNLILALIIGLSGGAGLCFLLDHMDNTVKGPEDVEKLANLSSLGIIPRLNKPEEAKKKKSRPHLDYSYSTEKNNPGRASETPESQNIDLINHFYPKLIIAEDYRTIRTSILLSHADRPPKTIVFSSALPQEGKSATVVNMAVTFAQLGERVLVVDSDLRKPRLHKIFEVENKMGLSSYLTGKDPLKDVVQKTFVENVFLIPSGPIPPNPSELVNSKKMKSLMTDQDNGFDFVLFDTPPVLAVIDAVIMSSIAEVTVFLIKAGKTQRKPFLNAVGKLKKAGARIIGTIFNELEVKSSDFHFMDYYRYYKYDYYGDSENNPPE